MDRLKGAKMTISLVNGASATLTNRFLKAHAEAWFIMKYSNDWQAGILVPLAFTAMVIPVTMENLCTVRLLRQNLGGESEHQDVAPDERDVQRDMAPDEQDVQRDPQQSTQGNWYQGSEEACEGGFWGGDENDLPEYEDEDDLPEYEDEDDLPEYEDD